MLQCYCVINAKIFWFLVAITRHPCVAKRKRCRWQIPESAPLIPGCWCPAPVWKFGYPGVPKAGAGVSGRLGATAGARNPRKSQAPVGRWPLGWKHVSFENGFEDYCWEEMSKKFQLKERGATYSNQDKGTADIKTHLCLYKWRKKEKIFLKRQQNLLWNSVREGWGRGWRLEVAELSFEEWGCDQPSFYLCKCKCKREHELSTERWAMELPPSIFTSPWLFISTKYFFIYLLCPLKKILCISVSLSKHTTNGPQISF